MTLPACADILGVESSPELSAACIGTLRVRITTDDTGGTRDVAPAYNHGIYDYLRNLNDTQGGVLGCPIDVDMKDTSYDPVKTDNQVDAWRQTREWSEVSSVFIWGTGSLERVSPKLMADHKVVIAGTFAGSLATPAPVAKDVTYPDFNDKGDMIETSEHKTSPGYPYVFFPATDYSTGIRIAMQAVWKLGAGRVAMVHDADTCSYCVEPLAAGKSYAVQLPSMSLGPDIDKIAQTANLGDADDIKGKVRDYIGKEIAKKKANPGYTPVSWLWVGNSLVSASLVGKAAAAAQQDINNAFPDPKDRWTLRVIVNNWGIGETVPKICGPECNGIYYGLFPVPRYGDAQNSAGMNALLQIHDKYRRVDKQPTELYQDVSYVAGYAAAVMWRRAVEAAVRVGHNTPTGDDLKEALESFKDVDLEGMTAGPVSFSPTDHRPQSAESIYRINTSGTLEYVDHYAVKLEQDWLGY